MRDACLRTIAVATDLAPDATAVLAWALELAREHRSEEIVVHALHRETPPSLDLAPLPQGYYRELRAEARAKLESLMTEVRPAGLAISVELVLGSNAPEILASAHERHADVIVLGAHRTSRWKQLLSGSTTSHVVREARLPIVTVHAGDRPSRRPTRTVVVPTDFSLDAAAAADTALRLVGPCADARLVLLHAARTSRARAAEREALDATASRVRERAGTLARHIARPVVRVDAALLDGPVADSVVAHATRLAADLIVMGKRDRCALARLRPGGIAARILAEAPCPVVTARAACN